MQAMKSPDFVKIQGDPILIRTRDFLEKGYLTEEKSRLFQKGFRA
jgi:hypothetical protein